MTPAVTLDELLEWNEESARFWLAHLGASPALLELPCDIGGAASVQALVRHIWSAELRWAQRIARLPVTEREAMPAGPLEALFDLHTQAAAIFRAQLDNPALDWEEELTLDLPGLAPDVRSFTLRKLAAHALFHSQRHWAQLATVLRLAGHPSGFRGDLLFSLALR